MSAPEPPAEVSLGGFLDAFETPPETSQYLQQEEEPIAQIYSEVDPDMESAMEAPTIEAVEHYILAAPPPEEAKISDEQSKPLSAIEEEDHLPLVDAALISKEESTEQETEAENVLSSSMQSLVDGLMSWGGQYDSEEDLNLPVGMATSIVLEGSGIASVN